MPLIDDSLTQKLKEQLRRDPGAVASPGTSPQPTTSYENLWAGYGNQQMPNYGSFYQGQGGQPVGLQNYLDNLKKRFGIG